MRFFNRFIRIPFHQAAMNKMYVATAFYCILMSVLLFYAFSLENVWDSLLIMVGVALWTTWYTRKLTIPAQFFAFKVPIQVALVDFTKKLTDIDVVLALEKKEKQVVLLQTQKLEAVFLAENEAHNTFYQLMQKAKTLHEQLQHVTVTHSNDTIAETAGLLILMHTNLLTMAEFTERALALPQSYPKKPTDAHDYTLQIIRVSLNRIEEHLQALPHIDEKAWQMTNERLRDGLLYPQY